jgi:phosphatidylglycerol---prolipoprotein diacylglyceryl transferase
VELTLEFPVYIGLGSWKLHPHLVFEAIAYTTGTRLALKNYHHSNRFNTSQRSSIFVGALVGALLGTKLLVLLQHIDLLWQSPMLFALLALQGKTIVGALLGGLIGVELTKKWIGIHQSTGDDLATPLIVGMAIGRLGCFLTGLSDRTYGTATQLPWGVDFGDGILRHPTQLYEIVFLVLLFAFLQWRSRYPMADGDRFKFFMTTYLMFRWAIDFLKPDFHPLFSMSAIQFACLGALFYYRKTLLKLLPPRSIRI